jgi:hypothetical protein
MSRKCLIRLLVIVAVLCMWGTTPLSRPAAAQKPETPPAQKKGNDYELRIVRVGNTFQGIRFMVSTGESWTMVLDRFEKVPETGPVPAGSYDITLVTDDKEWMAFRIDRNSGATWHMRGNKWHKVKEPGDKGPASTDAQPATTTGRWSEYGLLRKTDGPKDGEPGYVLVGKKGDVLMFVTSAKNAQLEPYLEKVVSVYGQIKYSSGPLWRAPVMHATHITVP